jgi:hypothetical protein
VKGKRWAREQCARGGHAADRGNGDGGAERAGRITSSTGPTSYCVDVKTQVTSARTRLVTTAATQSPVVGFRESPSPTPHAADPSAPNTMATNHQSMRDRNVSVVLSEDMGVSLG